MENTDAHIRVRGARVHNLRAVDVSLPRDALVAFTGVSGSGKSSIAFGTLYAEAQHRYLESVAPYARRLLQQLPAPDVDGITGLPPAVALAQARSVPSGRSTVGTLTAVSNSLRMLFSRAGTYPPGAEHLDSDSFSPNTAVGACPVCHGEGVEYEVTEGSLVPDPSLSIADGAIASWPGAWQGKNLRDILDTLGYDVHRPWRELPREEREWILFTDEQPVVTVHPVREAGRVQRPYQGTYSSARRLVLKAYASSASEARRERARSFMDERACRGCDGRRLNAAALRVTFAGRSIDELARMPLSALADLLAPWHDDPGPAGALVQDITARVGVLVELGLGYLGTARPAPTLSTGELQRIRLATQVRTALFGVVYVLDEPSAGLHPADCEALSGILRRLRDGGNTVCFVEHDMDIVRGADWVVDVGPGAGADGGRVLYSGPVPGLAEVGESVTRRYLFDPPVPERIGRTPSGTLELRGIDRNNLRGLDVDVPLGVFTAVTGVSGSGKSTLLGAIGEHAAARGRAVWVDQKPIGRTPRSNPATYTGLFDTVRRLFAGTDEAKALGYGPGRFSFNVPEGRCPTCEGEGFVSVELLFLPSTYAPCPDCGGARYNPDTLRVAYRGLTVAQVLDLSVDEALEFFARVPSVARSLDTLSAVGLGYLRLGQPATELSGGEAQRIKLAAELQRRTVADTVYLLDEPTTGLHPHDADVLMERLRDLIDAGATVVAAEHEMRIVATADHVVDLGPGGGDEGGRVVAAGTPAEVAAVPGSRTAAYLKDLVR
ncbi:ATP-binding cassette domain-containing protein [Nocardiopsis changdeensis]|uniref:UvrABC system protein A n=1 Tax=Nocardiopsis changdeensis TaxID=2831969 RepID=A0ABX8BMK0_9ACTN|nr:MULTISPECIES: excinuclease ABC subunit UvrA [Nocardiopsis]QUX22803.1 excinuclease ABC subunit UvrA [Nocardiopsis changdeensis]QYX38745.1 excinuclease ABC subunit UvrA [Nocardiopsis sp. MT53]